MIMIFISEISNGLGELLTSKIVNKLIEFIVIIKKLVNKLKKQKLLYIMKD
jgi:hypothetical protein